MDNKLLWNSHITTKHPEVYTNYSLLNRRTPLQHEYVRLHDTGLLYPLMTYAVRISRRQGNVYMLLMFENNIFLLACYESSLTTQNLVRTLPRQFLRLNQDQWTPKSLTSLKLNYCFSTAFLILINSSEFLPTSLNTFFQQFYRS